VYLRNGSRSPRIAEDKVLKPIMEGDCVPSSQKLQDTQLQMRTTQFAELGTSDNSFLAPSPSWVTCQVQHEGSAITQRHLLLPESLA
jgi:hypothetical protein